MRGTVYKLVRDRGFGFVRDEDGREFFLHAEHIIDFPILEIGHKVEFEPRETPKGLQAVRAKLVEC